MRKPPSPTFAGFLRKMFRLPDMPENESDRSLKVATELLAAWRAELQRGNRAATREIKRLEKHIYDLQQRSA